MVSVLLALLGAVLWGLAPIAGKVGLASVDALAALALRTLMASALILGFVLGAGGWHYLERVPARAWLPIGVEAVLAALVGDLAYYLALKYGQASTVALVMAISPLVTLVSAHLLLEEPITRLQLAGAILIVVGVFLVGAQAR